MSVKLAFMSGNERTNIFYQFIFRALASGSTFLQKLHLIYLVNDILHHCVRKNVRDLKNCLENVVIPMFCSADLVATNEQRAKLTKLLQLWESKAKFFDACVISKLKSPGSSMKEHRNNLLNQHTEIVAKFSKVTKTTMENYQKQHQVFIQHATQQIAQLEQQKQHLEQQMFAAVLPNNNLLQGGVAVVPVTTTPTLKSSQQQKQQQQQQSASFEHQTQQKQQQQQQQQQQKQRLSPHRPLPIPSLMSQKITPPIDTEHLHHGASTTATNDMYNNNNNNNNNYNNNNNNNGNNNNNNNCNSGNSNSNNNSNINTFIPDLSRPPPGFSNPNVGGGLQQLMVSHHSNSNMGAYGTQMAQQTQLQQQHQHQQQQQQQQQHMPHPNQIDLVNLNAAAAMHLAQQQQLQHQFQYQQQQQLSPQQQLPISLPTLQYPHLPQPTQSRQQQQQQLTMIPQQIKAIDGSMEDIPSTATDMDMALNLKPTVPYYDLPAGLMVPLIRLEDCSYKSLDPDALRIPPPQIQTERLTMALAAFYAPPTHDGPRDTDGWEKLGLYEYYKVKNAARKQKEDDIRQGVRGKSRSPTPVLIEPNKKKNKKNVKKRRYVSRSPTPAKDPTISRSRSKSRSRSRSRSPSSSRSRAQSPARGRNSRSGRYSQRRNSSRSPPAYRERERDRERDRDYSQGPNGNGSRESRDMRGDRSTRKERERSLTPPSFFGNNFTSSSDFIEETNKGHQMLMKMGWTGAGTGLGTNNQGIDQPIPSGDVRDRKDLYKGVGINLNDPFENFRKNKGAAFVHRMRTRDDRS